MDTEQRSPVRRLATGDEDIARKVVKRFTNRDVSTDYLAGFLADPKHYVFVAEVDDAVVGFLLAYQLPRLDGQSSMLFLYEIEVAEAHRRRGIGSALVVAALAVVKQNSWKEAFVLTNRSNPSAVAFYESTGGRIENGDDLLFVYDQL